MPPRPVPRIDWRTQFARLDPLFERRAGVAHVHAGPGAPSSAFARTLRSVAAGYGWLSVQIDPRNANTHYLRDSLDEIARIAGLAVEGGSDPAIVINVASDIHADGPVEIADIAVNAAVQADSDARAAKLLAERLSPRLLESPLLVVFFHSHEQSPEALRSYRTDFWDGAFATITAGLVVVDISDPAVLRSYELAWPPEQDSTIGLPDLLDDDARLAALEDLAAFALEQRFFETDEQARAFARTLVGVSLSVRDLHSNLGSFVADQGVV